MTVNRHYHEPAQIRAGKGGQYCAACGANVEYRSNQHAKGGTWVTVPKPETCKAVSPYGRACEKPLGHEAEHISDIGGTWVDKPPVPDAMVQISLKDLAALVEFTEYSENYEYDRAGSRELVARMKAITDPFLACAAKHPRFDANPEVICQRAKGHEGVHEHTYPGSNVTSMWGA